MNLISKIPKIQFLSDPERIDHFKQGIKAGATIYGRVLEVFTKDQYLVSLRGINLLAQSDIPMKKGDNFKTKILAKEPQLLLKILNTAEHAEGYAEKWGVKGADKQVLQEMLAAKIPMDKDTFTRINQIVKKFSGNKQLNATLGELVRAAAKLESMGLPANLDNMKNALSALKGEFNLAQLMEALNKLLTEHHEKLPNELIRFLRSMPLKFDPQSVASNLPNIVLLLGLLHESALKNLLTGKKGTPKLNLKWALMILDKLTGESSDTLKKALAGIESMQFVNLPDNISAPKEEYQLQIPLYYQGNWEQMNLHFHSKGGGKNGLDKDNCSIRISLDTRFLGQISALVDITNGFVTANIYCHNDEVIIFLQPQLNELEGGLDGIGYSIRSISLQKITDIDDSSETGPSLDRGDSTVNLMV